MRKGAVASGGDMHILARMNILMVVDFIPTKAGIWN